MFKADYENESKEIDRVLREANIKAIRKADIRRKFNLSHLKAPPIYSGLVKLGWRESWSVLERD